MFELLLAFFLGIFLGTGTGIIPGMHSNLVAAFIISWGFSGASVGVFLLAMATAHIFVGIIPALYLSLPDDMSFISLLPGQQLVKKGQGYEGVMIHAAGTFLTIIVFAPFLFFLMPFLPHIQQVLSPFLPLILSLAVISFLTKEKIVWRVTILFLTGLIGLISFTSLIQDSLLPLLSGLFGVPALLMSTKPNIPVQRISPIALTQPIRKILPLGWIAGAVVGFLPGVGAAHAASIVSLGKKQCSPETMLALLASIATANFIMAIAMSAAVGKARNGVIALLMEHARLSFSLSFAVVFAAAGFSYVVTCFCARFFAQHAHVLAHPFLPKVLLVFLCGLVFFVSGWKGAILLATATAIGFLPILLRIERSILMSSLVIPVIAVLW